MHRLPSEHNIVVTLGLINSKLGEDSAAVHRLESLIMDIAKIQTLTQAVVDLHRREIGAPSLIHPVNQRILKNLVSDALGIAQRSNAAELSNKLSNIHAQLEELLCADSRSGNAIAKVLHDVLALSQDLQGIVASITPDPSMCRTAILQIYEELQKVDDNKAYGEAIIHLNTVCNFCGVNWGEVTGRVAAVVA